MSKDIVKSARENSPRKLAYIGDAFYELLARTELSVARGLSGNALHKATVSLVNAAAQSAAADVIAPLLSEEETDILRRGKAGTASAVPRSASPKDYRAATGLEALFGYLFLIGEEPRARALFEVIVNGKENKT